MEIGLTTFFDTRHVPFCHSLADDPNKYTAGSFLIRAEFDFESRGVFEAPLQVFDLASG